MAMSSDHACFIILTTLTMRATPCLWIIGSNFAHSIPLHRQTTVSITRAWMLTCTKRDSYGARPSQQPQSPGEASVKLPKKLCLCIRSTQEHDGLHPARDSRAGLLLLKGELKHSCNIPYT